MSQVVNLLEVLWAYERMKESTILSPDEKQIIQKELFHALPPSQHCTQSLATRNIVASHLLDPAPSIKPDEEVIDKAKSKQSPIQKGHYKSKKEDRS